MTFYKDLECPVASAAEYIKDRLYFATLDWGVNPESTKRTHYFTVDEEMVYVNFYADFGPYNLAMLYHYCNKLNHLLKTISKKKMIVHYTRMDPQKRVNAAFLIGSYAILYLNETPDKAHRRLISGNSPQFIQFRDASIGHPTLEISLLDCLFAVYKAHKWNFFDFKDFDALEYEHYEKVEYGDLNWIVPQKFIAFCGPQAKGGIHNGCIYHSPQSYFTYFRENNVSTIIRLNKRKYEAEDFSSAGFDHRDLYFRDGTVPTDAILQRFLEIAESAPGAIAVHCKAGLGRTGSLIGCYIMKHYGFDALETIAWMRLCRPGSIIGHQQLWLVNKLQDMRIQGDRYRRKYGPTAIPKYGVYSMKIHTMKRVNIVDSDRESEAIEEKATHNEETNADSIYGILERVNSMKLDAEVEDENKNSAYHDVPATEPVISAASKMTQGDKLNQIKAQRQSQRLKDQSVSVHAALRKRRLARAFCPVLRNEPPETSLARERTGLIELPGSSTLRKRRLARVNHNVGVTRRMPILDSPLSTSDALPSRLRTTRETSHNPSSPKSRLLSTTTSSSLSFQATLPGERRTFLRQEKSLAVRNTHKSTFVR